MVGSGGHRDKKVLGSVALAPLATLISGELPSLYPWKAVGRTRRKYFHLNKPTFWCCAMGGAV